MIEKEWVKWASHYVTRVFDIVRCLHARQTIRTLGSKEGKLRENTCLEVRIVNTFEGTNMMGLFVSPERQGPNFVVHQEGGPTEVLASVRFTRPGFTDTEGFKWCAVTEVKSDVRMGVHRALKSLCTIVRKRGDVARSPLGRYVSWENTDFLRHVAGDAGHLTRATTSLRPQSSCSKHTKAQTHRSMPFS